MVVEDDEMTTSSSSESRGRLLAEAFVETVRASFEFRQFCSRIHERDSIPLSVGCDVFILNRAGLVPIDLTPLNEAEWRSKVGRPG
jgi:hypothetical protein